MSLRQEVLEAPLVSIYSNNHIINVPIFMDDFSVYATSHMI